MKTALDQLSGYAAYHRDRRNIATHLVGVPMIVQAVVVLLSRPGFEIAGMMLTPALAVLAATGVYYLLLDVGLGLALIALIGAMTWAGVVAAALSTAAWLGIGVGLFVAGWIIQFVGHFFEGRKPAFFDDVVGLLIGPMFVLAEVLFACGLRGALKRAIEARVGTTLIRGATGSVA
jgi:uncharacterized membrane protein YGL010W